MKKLALVMAIASAPFVASVAQASDVDVSVYGRAHVSVDFIDNGADYNEVNLSSRSSRLGFKAESKQEDYSVFMQIEQEISFAAGATGGNQKEFASRDTFVGIKGDSWGVIKVGQFDTPFKVARNPANLFGDQVGDMRNLACTGNMRFDERPSNTIQYSTPALNGLQVNIAYVIHEGEVATSDEDQTGLSASLTYKVGALDAAVAYESWSEDSNRGERDALRAALSYKVTDSTKVVGFYQMANHETHSAAEADVWGVGAEVGISSSTALKAMYMNRTSDLANTDATMLTVGVEHKLDKQARVYLNYVALDNDSASKLVPWDAARNSNIGQGVDGKTATALSLGMRYDF